MVCWAIKNGVPFDVAHCMDQWELKAYAITFAQLENGGQDWDWDGDKFFPKA